MARKGMLINYDYCTGCHTCEVACRVEHGFPDDQGGVADRYQCSYLPVLTDQCDQCAERREAGKDPACVHHCQAFVMRYGDVSELAGQAEEGSKSVLYFL